MTETVTSGVLDFGRILYLISYLAWYTWWVVLPTIYPSGCTRCNLTCFTVFWRTELYIFFVKNILYAPMDSATHIFLIYSCHHLNLNWSLIPFEPLMKQLEIQAFYLASCNFASRTIFLRQLGKRSRPLKAKKLVNYYYSSS